MESYKIRALIKAIIIYLEYNGDEISFRNFGENYTQFEEELNEKVNIVEEITFNIIKETT